MPKPAPLPEPNSVPEPDSDLARLLDWIDAQNVATPDRLTSEQLKVSGLLAGALKRSAPQSHGYGYVFEAARQASERLPLPGDVLGW